MRSSLLLLSVLLTACGPRMQTVKDYYPPDSDAGMRCVQNATSEQSRCETNNQLRLNQCHRDAEVQGQMAFDDANREYTLLLERYIDDNEYYDEQVKEYQEQRRLLIRDGELAYIKCSRDVNMTAIDKHPKCKTYLDKGRRRADELLEPMQPTKPVAPSLGSITSRIKSACRSTQVNCASQFDQAYQACGGRIEARQVCVANCDG